MRQVVAKGLRGLRFGRLSVRSWFLLTCYRALYPGLRTGRGVQLQRGVHISVVRGATLTLGDDVIVERNCQLVSEGNLSIGSNSFIGTGSIIVADREITIGRYALIGAYVVIRDQDHRISGEGPYSDQGMEVSPVSIADNVWIGTKATVLRGVSVGDNAVIGANAVVTRSVEPATIVGGVPANYIKKVGVH